MGLANPGSPGSGLAADPDSAARERGQECAMDWSGIGGWKGRPRCSGSRGFRERRRGKDDDDDEF